MRYQSRMDRGFMVTLLSASRFLVWRRCHVDACPLRILFTGKMPAATERAIWMPETVIDEPSSEIVGRAGDRPIYESLGDLSRNANLSESWHSVHRVG
jgi:hypothetical protein